jgi:hypothetical protein
VTTAGEPSGRTYKGAGVPRLVPRHSSEPLERVELDLATATLLPDPYARINELEARFMAVRGPHPAPMYSLLPAMRNVDGKILANYVTHALRADLPALDSGDAAVIWEQWRVAVQRLGASLRNRPDDTLMHIALGDLESRLYDVFAALKLAVASPGEVARAYCPWARAFFTQARLHPGAAP